MFSINFDGLGSPILSAVFDTALNKVSQVLRVGVCFIGVQMIEDEVRERLGDLAYARKVLFTLPTVLEGRVRVVNPVITLAQARFENSFGGIAKGAAHARFTNAFGGIAKGAADVQSQMAQALGSRNAKAIVAEIADLSPITTATTSKVMQFAKRYGVVFMVGALLTGAYIALQSRVTAQPVSEPEEEVSVQEYAVAVDLNKNLAARIQQVFIDLFSSISHMLQSLSSRCQAVFQSRVYSR